jgi:UDP-2,3-diacylglucosamine pyrophosphatase LpxH
VRDAAMSETVVIISDLHLGKGDGFDTFAGPGKTDALAAFLEHVGSMPGGVEIVINGDFVDFLQLEPWTLTVDRAQASEKMTRIVTAYKDTVFHAIGRFLGSPDHRVTVLLGNHDIELAFPEVWKGLADAILESAGADASGRLSSLALDRTRLTYVRAVGGVLVHIEHGNADDPYNGMNYQTLFHDVERHTSDFEYPPGTRLVYDIMNRHKREFRFVDLLKPEVPAVPFLLMALNPKAVIDAPGIAAKSIAAVGNGFVGWLRTAIAGPTLGRTGDASPGDAPDEQLSKDMAAAYQDAMGGAGNVTDADTMLLQQFLEKGGEGAAAVDAVMAPSLKGAKARLARTAIRSLGRPTHLDDATYYQTDHGDRPDAKWARARLTGDVKAVVFGHTHHPLKTEFEGIGLYVNSGAWANQMTLPGPADDVSEWLSRIRSNSEQNRMAFPTYVTLKAEEGGAAVSLNTWQGTERTLWQKFIQA